MQKQTCLSRRFFPGGREEAVYDSPDGLLLARTFSTSLPEERVRAWFDSNSALEIEEISVPSGLERIGEERFRLSLHVEDPEMGDRLLPDPVEVAGWLGSLHRSGLLHLDLASSPFATGAGKAARLVLWGDACLDQPSGGISPEVAAGGYCGMAADYYQFGLYMRMHSERSGQAAPPPLCEELTAHSPRRRILGARNSGLFPGVEEPHPLPRLAEKPVTFLESGSWQHRDSILNEIAASSTRRGWPARVLRCSPAESGRPLPDRPRLGPRAVSAFDLLSILFPGITGVNRLLIVDQADFASADLQYMLSELIEIRPPHLRLVVGMSGPAPGLASSATQVHRLDGSPTLAEDVPFDLASGGWTGPSWFGPRMRVSVDPASRSRAAISPDEIWSEGGLRVTADLWSAGILPADMRSKAAESFLRTGRPGDALATAGEEDFLIRSEALLGVGRSDEAEALVRSSLGNGEPGGRAHLLSDILLDQGRLDEAGRCLEGFSDPASVMRRAGISDMAGNPGDALGLIESILPSVRGPGRTGLLCTRCTMQMRLGFYRDAFESADEAVKTARGEADSAGLTRSLQERGRVSEVRGFWREALEDYRLASLLCSELGMKVARPVEIDQLILETRMGLLEDAARTRATLSTRLRSEPGSMDALTLDQIDSCVAVLTGMGSAALPEAERGAVRAAELGMPLRQGLFLLYKGQLHAQAGEQDEARESLRHSRALAGLLGDRHLSLLAGLALAEIGQPSEPGRLTALASELGLASEALEAAVISGDVTARSDALLGLLELPSPLRACALAAGSAGDIEPAVLERLRSERRCLLDSMDGERRSSFAGMTSALDSASVEEHGASGDLLSSVQIFSEWLASFLAGSEGIEGLAGRFGLDSLSDTPEGCALIGEGPPRVYGSGPGLDAARFAAPLISSVMGAIRARPQVDEGESDEFPEIRGGSTEIRELKSAMSRVARLDLPVLIAGETGTGKELVARGLHRLRLPEGPFIPVDCGAIPENLLESELFGARRGAYTDLRSDRQGLLASADGGTLFLDEIGNLSPVLQVKLLRVLETGKYRPLGSPEEHEARFRLLAATNSDLVSMIREGRFRADLYYRISVIVICTPPLRGRVRDIRDLSRAFAAQALDGREPVVTRAALGKLASHSWPGNVRELRNVVQRAAVLSRDGTIREEDIAFGPPADGVQPPVSLESLESAAGRHVASVLGSCGGSVIRASEILECDPKTVRKYVRLYGDLLERKGLQGR